MINLDEIVTGVIADPAYSLPEEEVVTEPEEEVVVEEEELDNDEPTPEPVVEPKHEEAIPYERFKEVLDERNFLRSQFDARKPAPVEATPQEEEVVEDEEELVFESPMEERLYNKLVDLESRLADKEAIIEKLTQSTTAQEEETLLREVAQEFTATLEELGGGFSEEDTQAILTEAQTYANIPDLSVKDAVKRAYHYLSGSGSIKPTAPAPKPKADPLAQVRSQKEKLGPTNRSQPVPKAQASMESVTSLDDAVEYAMRQLADE